MNNKIQQPDIPGDVADAVLRHIACYRMTTLDAASCFPAAQTADAFKRTLKQLSQDLLLAPAPLFQGKTYWHLTERGAKKLAVDHAGPLSESAKLRAYAIFRFCCLEGKPRRRLTSAELFSQFSGMPSYGLPANYFLEMGEESRIGLIRVDAGHHGRWDRVVQSLRQDVSRHFHHPVFAALAKANRFGLALITAFPQKAARLREALSEHADTKRLCIDVVAMPELVPLLTSIQRKEVTANPG